MWAPAPQKKGKKGLWIGLAAGVAAIAVALGAGFAFGILPFGAGEQEAEGEIFLVAANEQGPDPFSAVSLSPAVSEEIAPTPTETTPPGGISSAGGAQIAANSGAKPGLFGGSNDAKVCDPQAQADFLAQNPALAAGFVKALEGVTLPDGTPLAVSNLRTYLTSLTPVLLTEDTRVTNHGFRNGEPYALQAVLQRGTAVLVDRLGVPRVKCNCGNPLLEPVASSRTPVYLGKVWDGFDPSKVTVVQPAPEPIFIFVLTNINDPGTTIDRNPGSVIINPTPDPVPAGWYRTGTGSYQVDPAGLPLSTERVSQSTGGLCVDFGLMDWAVNDPNTMTVVRGSSSTVCDQTGTGDNPPTSVQRNAIDRTLLQLGGACDDPSLGSADRYSTSDWVGMSGSFDLQGCVDGGGWSIDHAMYMIAATDAFGNTVNVFADGSSAELASGALKSRAEALLFSFTRP